MTAKEYMEIAKRKGNERVCELIKFLQDNVLVSGHIRQEVANCRTPTHGKAC